MLVKTFQAGEMSEALRMVKAEMGLDAMILSSKKERRKGILGYFCKPYFEVTAALDPRPVSRPNPYREEPPPAPAPRELTTREEFQNSMLGPLAREVRELKMKVEALTRKEAEMKAVEGAADAPRAFAREDLDEIKKLLYSAVSGGDKQARPVTFPLAGGAPQQAPQEPQVQPAQLVVAKLKGEEPRRQASSPSEGHPFLDQLATELRAEELGPLGIELIMEQLRPAAQEGAEIDELRGLLAETLTGLVRCAGSLRMKKSGPRIMALVGPTGVGKTTTIAKLAAMHALNRRLSVALITTDNFRVGAVEQLKTYAKIMDLPLEVVASAQELSAALEKHKEKDLILIDTAGRSPKDEERIEELKAYLECESGIEAYLCLAATTRPRELDEIVATFGQLPVSRFLFTKLDESESFGCIVDMHLKHKLPLSYFTTGQKVPEDIEVATARKLASLVVKESDR
jgi:flagellar biosynthesis protein FlhF